MRVFRLAISALLLWPSLAGVVAFEGVTDGTPVNRQFPPHSSEKVADGYDGPMSIVFASPILSFDHCLTYLARLTPIGFHAQHLGSRAAAPTRVSQRAHFGLFFDFKLCNRSGLIK